MLETKSMRYDINPHYQVPQRGLEAVGPLVAYLQAYTLSLSLFVPCPETLATMECHNPLSHINAVIYSPMINSTFRNPTP